MREISQIIQIYQTMKYFIAENGQQAGPFEPNELLLHGLTVNSLVWCEGMPNWTSASQVPELMSLFNRQTLNSAHVDTPILNSGTPNHPYAQPQYYPSNMPEPQQFAKTWYTESIIVTILAILCCFNPIGLCAGIYSIIKANSAKNKAMTGDLMGSADEASSAKTWMIVSAITIAVWIIFLFIMVVSKPNILQQIKEGAFG